MDSKSKILIVDDEPLILKLFTILLQKKISSRLEILTASSTEQAIEILQHNSIHLVLVDLNMHATSGLYLIDWIIDQDTDKDKAIVVISAMHQEELQHVLKHKGVIASFSKLDIVGGGEVQKEFIRLVKSRISLGL